MSDTNSFLPETYEQPKTASNYLKLQDGENRFRILSSAIVGWIDWKDKKPMRFTMNAKPEKPVDSQKPVKHFWAFVVLDYADMKIKIMEITQGGIQTAITALSKSADWGNPTRYDIKITKTGKSLETEYQVIPVPPKPLAPEIDVQYKAMTVNLNALFTNGDPFAAPSTGTSTTQSEENRIGAKSPLTDALFAKAKARVDAGEVGVIGKLQLVFTLTDKQLTDLQDAEKAIGTPPVDDLPF